MKGAYNVDFIAPVPPSPGKDWDLPTVIAGLVSARTGLPILPVEAGFIQPKPALKEIAALGKWEALKKAEPFCRVEHKPRHLLMIDDLYQSGATAHFWASKFEQSGVKSISFLGLSKANRDTDNQ